MEVYVLTSSSKEIHSVLGVTENLETAMAAVDSVEWKQVTDRLWFCTSDNNAVMYEINKKAVVS